MSAPGRRHHAAVAPARPPGTATPGSAIEVRGWGWRYAGRKAWACRGVDLTITPGERVLIVGASGSGKSTLLRAVAGLLDPESAAEQEGRLSVDGAPAPERRDRIGMLFQDPESSLVMSRAGDDVAFGLENAGVARDQIWPRVDAALSEVGFGYGRDRPTAALSGGEQQRLALAGALVRDPRVLILDEPTANLDPAGAALVLDSVRRVQARTGATLVVVEHQVDHALPLVDRVVVIEPGGGIIEDGDPGEVFAARGPALAAAGVWVPASRPARPHPVAEPEATAEPHPTAAPDAAAAPGDPAAPPTGQHTDRPSSAALLQARGLTRTHPGGRSPAVIDASLDLHRGEATVLTGPNGSGKSTLAMMIAGLDRPDRGSVRFTGIHRDLHTWKAAELCRRVGTVFQDPEHQFVTSTVRAELLVGAHRAGTDHPTARRRADDLLARLRLDRLAEANPFTLSGGEKRRLAVAAALATEPALLVLDEPTFGQDANTWAELVALCATLRDAGTAILAVTHDRAFADVLADRRIEALNGRLS